MLSESSALLALTHFSCSLIDCFSKLKGALSIFFEKLQRHALGRLNPDTGQNPQRIN
jgi:hypothetical protein